MLCFVLSFSVFGFLFCFEKCSPPSCILVLVFLSVIVGSLFVFDCVSQGSVLGSTSYLGLKNILGNLHLGPACLLNPDSNEYYLH